MTFKLAINMPGAISAGAYTAGVLDFLVEALDAWYVAKAAGNLVPGHDLRIEAFTGASAGGMCAAISAVLLQGEFQHIPDPANTSGTNNRLFESWVNRIDISHLLQTDDLVRNQPFTALLNSSIIDAIAAEALRPITPQIRRPYVSPDLTVLLSLTNLRGVPYSLSAAAPDSVEQTTFFFGDRIRFQTTHTNSHAALSPQTHALNLDAPADLAWQLLQTAAIATGAFPAFLAPRVLQRSRAEYNPPLWASSTSVNQGTPPPMPTFPPGMPDPFETLNVDGGVTNNDPFNYARDLLAALPGHTPGTPLPTAAEAVDRAVLTIAPFPTREHYTAAFDSHRNSGLSWTLPRLLQALISQSRFFGEALSENMSGTTFSSFLIAPSDNELVEHYAGKSMRDMPPALQCATLGAFGGFFERGFRAHDFALGRRNCQKFLMEHLILPVTNPVIAAGLPKDEAARASLLNAFRCKPPEGQADGDWLPLIPLCSPTVAAHIPPVPRFRMSRTRLRQIVNLIEKRLRGVLGILLQNLPNGVLYVFLVPGRFIIPWLAKRPLTAALEKQLGDALE